MTREDIIKAMGESGVGTMLLGVQHDKAVERLTRFAALVAAAERERIIAANAPELERCNAYIKALEASVLAEREACAKVCEETDDGTPYNLAEECAAAIRARSRS